MKVWKWLKWVIATIVIAILVIGIILSINYDINKNGNFVTMLAGLLSAFATFGVGIIAIWQNNKFRKYADRQEDIYHMPDFYKTEINSDKRECIAGASRNNVYFHLNTEVETIQCNLNDFVVINAPIIELQALNLTCRKHNHSETYKYELAPKTLMLATNPYFTISLSVPLKYWEFEYAEFYIVFGYKNYAGVEYRKSIGFTRMSSVSIGIIQPLKRACRAEDYNKFGE